MKQQKLPLNQIIQGDCVEILHSIPENSVDLIVADPPYNLQLKQDLWRPNHTKVDAVDDGWDKFSGFTEYDRFVRSWLTGCRRVLKNEGTLWVMGTYHNIFRIGSILQDLDFWILNDVIWIKNNPMPNFRGVRFTNAHETLIWAQKTKGSRYTFNHHSLKALNDDLQMRSDWYLPLCSGKERRKIDGKKAHTTQKPECLLFRILLATSNQGDIVLDPFFGTGTTGSVAKKLGRKYIGIEQSDEYIRIAKDRISDVKPAAAETLDHPKPRSWDRVPFGRLLEVGLLHPGQTLTFAKNTSTSAIIMANGNIQSGGVTGSIHGVAKALLNGAPANGWDAWLYLDNGVWKTINHIRQKYLDSVENHAKIS